MKNEEGKRNKKWAESATVCPPYREMRSTPILTGPAIDHLTDSVRTHAWPCLIPYRPVCPSVCQRLKVNVLCTDYILRINFLRFFTIYSALVKLCVPSWEKRRRVNTKTKTGHHPHVADDSSSRRFADCFLSSFMYHSMYHFSFLSLLFLYLENANHFFCKRGAAYIGVYDTPLQLDAVECR